MIGVDVHLAEHEVDLVQAVGAARQRSAELNDRADFYGYTGDDPLGQHVTAAGGELAAAVTYGLPWTGCYFRTPAHPKKPDLGRATEVRTGGCSHHRLILHPEDADDWMFVLVVGALPRYRVVGHIRGELAKRREYWSDPAGGRPAFFVPQTALCTPPVPV